MNPKVIHEKVQGIKGEFGFGEVYKTGRIDTHKLVSSYRNYLKESRIYRSEAFNYVLLEFKDQGILYKGIEAKKVVFCEGFGMNPPFFNYLPLNGTKGETITIKAPNLEIDFLVKSTLFVLPLGKEHYKIGATFN